jgi:hypothetical protein
MMRVLLRAAPWRALLGLSAAGAAAGALAHVLPGGTGAAVLLVALVLGGAAAACALDEPAAAVVAACPVRRGTQVLARAVAATVPLLTSTATLLLWAVGHHVDHLLALQAAGCWSLGFALAAVTRKRLDEPGELVAAGLGLFLLTLIFVPTLDRHLALFPPDARLGQGARSWWAVLAGCALALALVVPERRWATAPAFARLRRARRHRNGGSS